MHGLVFCSILTMICVLSVNAGERLYQKGILECMIYILVTFDNKIPFM